MERTCIAVTATLLACYISALCANALQASPSFPETPRHNIAQRYLDEGHPYTNGYHFDEGHPYTYNPTKGSDMGLSHAMRRNRPADDGIERGFQDTSARNFHYNSNTFSESNNVYSTQSEDSRNQLQYEPQFSNQNFEIEGKTLNELPQQQKKRSALRRKSKLVPRQLSSSILRKSRSKSKNQEAVIKSSALLTFEEEKEIAEHIRCFRSVTRTRDDMVEWMSRETGYQNQNKHRTEPSEYQWASACSLTVDQLHEVLSRRQEARTRLIQGNVGLVTMIAKRYYNMLNGGMDPSLGRAGGTDATLKLDDLVQEGYMGIMEAAERFDPTKGNRFSTYGTHWIRQRILRSIAESSRTIRLPVHVQTNIRNMHKLSKQLEMTNGRRPSTPELAHEMDVPLDKIHLYQHLSKNVLSLELPVDRHSNTDDKRTIGDRVACTEVATPDEDFLSESLRGEVHSMLESLGDVERLVLTHRFGLDDGIVKSLRETAEGMGVSSDTVRSVEAKALNKLRQPGVNYRLKDYCSPDVLSDGNQYYEQPQYRNGWTIENNYVEEHNQEHHEEEQYQMEQQHYYHYPHHMNHAPRIKTSDNMDDDQGDYDRPTPESIWSF